MANSPGRARIPPDLTIAFILLAAMVAASLAFARQQARDVQVMAKWMIVQREIGEVLSATRDGESGERGYLLTSDTSYLAPYEDAGERTQAAIARLRSTNDRYAHDLANRLQPLVDARF